MFVANGKLQEAGNSNSNPNPNPNPLNPSYNMPNPNYNYSMPNPNYNLSTLNPNPHRKIRITPPKPPPMITNPSGQLIDLQQSYANQLRYLFLVRHAKECSRPAEACKKECRNMKMLLEHMKTCSSVERELCEYGYRCGQIKGLIRHYKGCNQENCPVCVPYRARVRSLPVKRKAESEVVKKEGDKISVRTSENVPMKRMKIEHETKELMKNEDDRAVVENKNSLKMCGVSLIELFTVEQIEAHISSLGKWKGGRSRRRTHCQKTEVVSSDSNACSLCGVERIIFDPLPIYCTPCGVRIKKYKKYYVTRNRIGNRDHFVCLTCYNARGTVMISGENVQKAIGLEEKIHDITSDELWVQCDKCQAWQHQICALFNGRRNAGGKAPYICPECCIEELENGQRVPLHGSCVLGAKDLPITKLSNHIQNRLFRRCEQERQERANYLGKNIRDVPGVEALVVRVVSSVDKTLEVKQHFRELCPDGYPSEFPYKSKSILLFQNIEGVEVCLFGMFVQEYGSECKAPNERRVYISYLDSVKYFRPEVKTVRGEALRTFVYHEILIGYLDYCKMRGFTSCYIWACPPLKDDDYIMYCHPIMQKIPKTGKLREWYHSMLEKAMKENIVVDITNIHDYLIHPSSECKAPRTTTRLPYLDGDYLPGAFEDMIAKIGQDDNGRKPLKKGNKEKSLNMRALKDFGHTDSSKKPSKDLLLLWKLKETISPMKQDFILVHLQHSCTCCSQLMISGNRWVCNKCKTFQLCDICHGGEEHQHKLFPIEVRDVPADTKDADEIMENELFDNRHAFLGLCEANRYQYDTLRRAKHSSMMMLYHLHNPTAPAFLSTCRVCNHDIEIGQGWRCETCQDYEECSECFEKGGSTHLHSLTRHKVDLGHSARSIESWKKLTHLLNHCQSCQTASCFSDCVKVKKIFSHCYKCKTRLAGGCGFCKKVWNMIQYHARHCKEAECQIPRCKDLKAHHRVLAQQFDSRRRAATAEMMRNRAAEIEMNIILI